MSRRDAPAGALVQAAGALEEELRQLDALASEARRLPLTSRKNVEKTAAKMQELGGFEERLGARLRAVVEAIAGARGVPARRSSRGSRPAPTSCSDAVTALVALLEHYQGLGSRAQALSAAVKEAAAGPADRDASAARTALAEVRQRVEELVAAAERVSHDADEQQFEDVSRDADALRQSLLAIQNRLGLLTRS